MTISATVLYCLHRNNVLLQNINPNTQRRSIVEGLDFPHIHQTLKQRFQLLLCAYPLFRIRFVAVKYLEVLFLQTEKY